MKELLKEIRKKLEQKTDEKKVKSFQHFFKEKIISLGVKAKDVEIISKEYYKKYFKDKTKNEIFEFCEYLFQSEYFEENIIACRFIIFCSNFYEKKDIYIFERWIDSYVNNWAVCDTFCNHAVGEFLEKYPESIENLKLWSKSENLWKRRASAVSLIIPARKGLFFKEILEIAENLLLDKEDLVQKAYGWMLKAASLSETFVKIDEKIKKEHLENVYNFLLKHKSVMPRTSLRYAIEKMPDELRKVIMTR